MKWEEVRINDFAEIVSGGTPSTSIASYWNGDISWITPNDLSKHTFKYISYGERNISEEGLKNSSAKIVPKNSILLTTRAPIGYVAIAQNDLCTNQGFKNLICKAEKADFNFIYYLLKNNTETLISHGTGSTFKELSAGRLMSIAFLLPPLPIQKKIASILSTYDDLIENNLQRIELLEKAARELYKEWFVRFKFPGHEKARFVDGLPEGWERKKLGDLGEIITGKTPSTKVEDYFGGDILFIKTPDMHKSSIIIETEDKLSEKGANSQINKYILPFSIMIACIGERLGVVSMNGERAQTNQQINTLAPKEEYLRSYSFFALKDLKELLKAIGGGATMPNVNKTKFENIEIKLPSRNILIQFNQNAMTNFQQMLILIKQNSLLRQARDLLFPRLMKGEIEI